MINLLRQAQLAEAKHTNDLLGLGDLTEVIQQLAKGTHILIEGRPELRPPRVVCHVRTDLDRWANYTDAAITGGTDAPTSPFDDNPMTDPAEMYIPAPEDEGWDDPTTDRVEGMARWPH